ncbi:MAG: DoxX family protein [Verrucomicrobiota bacterium]|jgi:hypothetical protein|nr:DoxX family protein [Verrucomicrobiota bacterium]
MTRPVRPFYIWVARLAVGGLFLAACLSKIHDPQAFALVVYRYRLLPDILINIMAILLPWMECVTALAVLFATARWRAAGSFLIGGMLLVFTLAISLNLIRGIEISCGCFSTRADVAVSDGWNLFRNVALIWLSTVVFLDAFRRMQAQAEERPS